MKDREPLIVRAPNNVNRLYVGAIEPAAHISWAFVLKAAGGFRFLKSE